jgi:hypothetical protein
MRQEDRLKYLSRRYWKLKMELRDFRKVWKSLERMMVSHLLYAT